MCTEPEDKVMTIDIDEAKVRRSGPTLWLAWTLATAAGMLLGFVPFALLSADLDLLLVRILLPLWAGFLVGLFQWLVLRPYLTHAADWLLNGGAGWALGFALGLLLIESLRGNPLGALLGYLLFGLSIGVMQWPVLRREIPNALAWIAASIIGWASGAYLSQAVLTGLVTNDEASLLLRTAVSAGVTGLAAGAITGLALVWIVRQPELEGARGRPAAAANREPGP
jgi:hypothetical protein